MKRFKADLPKLVEGQGFSTEQIQAAIEVLNGLEHCGTFSRKILPKIRELNKEPYLAKFFVTIIPRAEHLRDVSKDYSMTDKKSDAQKAIRYATKLAQVLPKLAKGNLLDKETAELLTDNLVSLGAHFKNMSKTWDTMDQGQQRLFGWKGNASNWPNGTRSSLARFLLHDIESETCLDLKQFVINLLNTSPLIQFFDGTQYDGDSLESLDKRNRVGVSFPEKNKIVPASN
jgi:hypothetical protein